MNTPGSSATLSILTRSPSNAPPVKGDVGSTAMTPTLSPESRKCLTTKAVMLLFPAPGGPVSPIRRAWPVFECSDPRISSNPGRWFSTMLTTRANAASLPAWNSARSASEDTRENPFLPSPHRRRGPRGSLRMIVAEHVERPVDHEAQNFLARRYRLPFRIRPGDLGTNVDVSNNRVLFPST